MHVGRVGKVSDGGELEEGGGVGLGFEVLGGALLGAGLLDGADISVGDDEVDVADGNVAAGRCRELGERDGAPDLAPTATACLCAAVLDELAEEP